MDSIRNEIMLLNLQMILDPMNDQLWEYTAQLENDRVQFLDCRLYCGQPRLSDEHLYLVDETWIDRFPVDQYSYITTGSRSGLAPHICNINQPFPAVVNLVLTTFQRYRELEMRLSSVITGGGDLNDICLVASDFFNNPVYIHDDMFSVLGVSHRIDGMLDFEYNEHSGKINIPLWLVNEFKFDDSYQQTLSYHQASVWGNDRYPHNIRSLFLNLWDDQQYVGRIMVNEIRSQLQPGQYCAIEYFGRYVLLMMNYLEQRQISSHNYRETLANLIARKEVDRQDLRTMLNILDWAEQDSYLCLLLEEQSHNISVRSFGAWNHLISSIQGCASFHYQHKLCVLINLAKTDLDPQSFRNLLAPHIRDSCMYCGVSNPIRGIHEISTGFAQATVALNYIKEEDSSNWFVSFSSCALSYIRECACHEFAPPVLVHPAIQELRQWDKANGTQYYETLRAYLFCERDIPQTSQALIIHRTTLTYRLGKILELTNLNLDDHNLRLYLLLSFHIMDHAIDG